MTAQPPFEPGDDESPLGDSLPDIRSLLRDEAVPDDELARERRIRSALAAFDDHQREVDVPHSAEVGAERVASAGPTPGRTVGNTWLAVAAAVLVLAAVGIVVTLNQDSSMYESARMESSDAGSQYRVDDPEALIEDSDAQGIARPNAPDSMITDLGEHATRDDLLLAAGSLADAWSSSGQSDEGRSPGDQLDPASPSTPRSVPPKSTARDDQNPPSTTQVPPSEDHAPCIGQLEATGEVPIAVGSVGGVAVIVVLRDGNFEVVEVRTCTPMP